MENFQRPTVDEDEEDLLKFQEEFLKNPRSVSSVKLVKKKATKTKKEEPRKDVVAMDIDAPVEIKVEEKSSRKRSRFAMKQGSKNTERTNEDMEAKMDEQDTHITNILSKIQERDISNERVQFPVNRGRGFPIAAHIQGKIKTEKKASIFAQQIQADPEQFGIKKPSEYAKMDQTNSIPVMALPKLEQTVDLSTLKSVFPDPVAISGVGLMEGNSTEHSSAVAESKQIHDESLEKLSQMTEQEILTTQQQLLKTLNPSLVEFIKSKHSQTANKNSHSSKRMKTKDEEFLDKIKESSVEVENEPPEDEQISEDFELPIPPSKNWLNMKTVEWDKMQWTKEMPEANKDKQIEFPHRFDFNGNLLDASDDIPTYVGLHHHGEEPSLPGYSLQELMTLARSQFKQQRVLALKTLAKVLEKDANGTYKATFNESISQILFDAGLLFLLRWSLDEQNTNLVSATVFAMHSFICLPSATDLLDEMFFGDRGNELPSLHPLNSRKKIPEDETDFELSQKDVVASLLRMNVLQRLRYIIEVMEPPAGAIIHILEILKQFCLHSSQTCIEIEKCQRLLQFITSRLNNDKTNQAISFHCEAVSLLRYLATGGRHLAGRILTNELTETIILYLKATSFAHDTASKRADIQIEMWKFATVLCGYEFLKPQLQDLIITCVMPKLQTANEVLYDSLESCSAASGTLHECATVVNFCATAVLVSHDGVDIVAWSDVAVWVVSLLNRSNFLLKHDGINMKSTKNILELLVLSSLKYLTSFYKRSKISMAIDSVDLATKVEGFTKDILCSLHSLMNTIACETSTLAIDRLFANTKTIPALPSFPSCTLNNRISLPLQLLAAYLRCCVIVCNINKSCCTHLVPSLQTIHDNCRWMTEDGTSISPQTCFLIRSKVFCSYWFTRLCHALILQDLLTDEMKRFYHTTSLTVFSQLTLSDEFFVNNILSTQLFQSNCFVEGNSLPVDEMSKLHVNENAVDEMKKLTHVRNDILTKGCQRIPEIRNLYLKSLELNQKAVLESKNRSLPILGNINCYLLPPCDGSYVPCDWIFLPLLQEYEEALNSPDIAGSTTMDKVLRMQRCLYFICIIKTWRPTVFARISTMAIISRIMCVFLAGNDFFLDESISECVSYLLKECCRLPKVEKFNFGIDVPGLSFYDFYCSLLDQFGGVSFGNSLFSSVLFLPLHQRHPSHLQYRKALWCERQELLRAIQITEDQLHLPRDWYFEPFETDVELLKAYIRTLSSGTCSCKSTPLLYHLAVHHIASYLMSDQNETKEIEQKNLRKMTSNISNEEVRNHIFMYHEKTKWCF